MALIGVRVDFHRSIARPARIRASATNRPPAASKRWNSTLTLMEAMKRMPKTDPPFERRQFLGELAAGAAALAAVACAPAATATNAPSQAPKPAAAAPQTEIPSGPLPVPPKVWDSSWMGRITAKHKAIFDAP